MVTKKYRNSPLQMRGGGGLDVASKYLNATVLPLINETLRVLPDSILFGSILMTLMTQSFSMAMFSLAMVETAVIGGALRKLLSYVDLFHTLPPAGSGISACYPSVFAPTLETLMMFGKSSIESAFPSLPVFYVSSATAYVVGSLWTQQQELQSLGPEYASRFYVSVFASVLLLFALITYRIAFGCDTAGIILTTLLLGFVIGGLIFYQNMALFGRDATNLIGIPLLRDRSRDGKPLYVCTQKGVE
jgi:hypothetical protein